MLKKQEFFRSSKVSILQLLGVLIDFPLKINSKFFYKFLIPGHMSIPILTKPSSMASFLQSSLIRISIKLSDILKNKCV